MATEYRKMYSDPDITHIGQGIFIGNLASSYNLDVLRQHQINEILSGLSTPQTEAWDLVTTQVIPKQRHYFIRMTDKQGDPLLSKARGVCAVIHSLRFPNLVDQGRRVRWPLELGSNPLPVLVHCGQGISRSVAVAIAYMICSEGIPYQSGLRDLRQYRPQAKPNDSLMEELSRLERLLADTEWTREQ
jgi:dual specificity phosphatase 12